VERSLTARESAVLAVLRAAGGRVVARADLAKAAGLDGLSERRVDGVLVSLRRHLPEGAVVSVRGRGWLLREG
jgi:DNA-binding response OmpR family regulator